MSHVVKEVVKLRTRQSVTAALSPQKISQNQGASLESNGNYGDEKGSPVDPTKLFVENSDTEANASATDSEKINFIVKQIQKLTDLWVEIKELKREIKLKDDRIHELEDCVDTLEQYSRQGKLIISGLNTSHRS